MKFYMYLAVATSVLAILSMYMDKWVMALFTFVYAVVAVSYFSKHCGCVSGQQEMFMYVTSILQVFGGVFLIAGDRLAF
jgi:hypothetical protein